MLWDSVRSYTFLRTVPVDAVKGLFKVIYICVQMPLTFCALFRANIWSMHPLPGINPACYLRSLVSTAVEIPLLTIVAKIIEWR